MPAPLSPEEHQRRKDALAEGEKAGLSKAAIARALGMGRTAFSEWYREIAAIDARRWHDPAVQQAMDRIGMMMTPRSGWLKTQPDENGLSASLHFTIKEQTQDVAEVIRQALADLPAAPPIAPPEYADNDLLTVIAMADTHFGLMAWGKETGSDYDTKTAAERVVAWVSRCIAASPKSGTAVLLDVGDLTHANDQTNQTPRGKHNLDTDTRTFKTMQTAIQALATAADQLASHHDRVIIRILPGNHNPDAYLAIMFSLGQRYRDNPRVTVQEVPGEFFVHEFGDVLIAAHHGDKARADRLVMFLADEYAPIWGRTKYRFLFTGHLHHHKSQDIGGCTWEQLRAVTERDAYAVSHAYSARAQLQAITYHRHKGEVQRVKVGA